MNADNIKFRASSMGYLMTDPISKSEEISETTKVHLIDVFVSNKYGRNTDVLNKYTTKGLMVEEDSLTLYSLFKKQFYKKNQDRIENEWITGCPDITTPELIDIKSSWDIYTFLRINAKKLNANYYWQLQAYMDLTGSETSKLAYCLVDTPDALVFDEKRRLQYKMNVIDPENEDFIKACAEIDKLSKYSDIPLSEKVIEIEIKRNEEDIKRMHERVEKCREYMNRELFKSLIEQAA